MAVNNRVGTPESYLNSGVKPSVRLGMKPLSELFKSLPAAKPDTLNEPDAKKDDQE